MANHKTKSVCCTSMRTYIKGDVRKNAISPQRINMTQYINNIIVTEIERVKVRKTIPGE